MRTRNVVGRCVLSLLLPALAPAAAAQPFALDPDGQAVAYALARDAPPLLGETVVAMYASSPTFRRQCLRLAASDPVVIRLRLDSRLPTASARARAAFTRRDGRLVAADIALPSRDVAELIAHEIEHLLEQLDGIDLPRHVGTPAVWQDRDGAFETARAVAIGRRVAHEVRAGTSLVLVRR